MRAAGKGVRPPFWRRSIKWRIILAVAFAITLPSVVGGVFRVWEEGRSLSEKQSRQAQALAKTLAVNSVSWIMADDVVGLAEVVASLSHYPELRYAMVLSPSGRVLAHSRSELTGMAVADPVSRAMLRHAPQSHVVADDGEGVDAAAPVQSNGRLLGWTRVALGKEGIRASRRVILQEAALFVAAALGVSFLLGMGLASRITRELSIVSETAGLIRQGRRDVRVNLAGEDEIGRLGEDLNAMLDTLASKERNLLEAQQLAHLGHWELELATGRLQWSEEVFRIFEIDSTRFPASYEAFLAAVHPDDRDGVERAYRESVESRQPYQLTHRLLFSDGRVKHVQERGETAFDADGRPLRSLGTVQDITERVLIEQRLEKEMLRYKTLFGTMLDGFYVLDVEGRVVEANRAFAEMLGYSEEEAAALRVTDWNAQWSAKETLATVHRLMHQGEVFETLHRRLDGTLRTVEVCAAGVVIDGQQLLFCAARDVTERKQAEEALRELNASLEQRVREEVERGMRQERLLIQQSRLAALGELVRNISHHWRQPLNTVALAMANIEDAYRFNELDEQVLHDYVQLVNRTLQTMSGTIDNFRNFFQPDSGKRPLDVGRIVRELVGLLEAGYRSVNIQLAVKGEEKRQVMGYPNEFSQVLQSLLVNAREAILAHGAETGRIEISIQAEGNTLRLTIQDNGGGMPEGIPEGIFDPYFTTKETGTGLGLYISRMIVEKMGGKIELANVEEGLRATITLPLLAA